MLLDNLNLNNNSLVSLPSEHFRSCLPSLTDYSFGGGSGNEIAAHDIFTSDTSNFLLGIPFAADSSHMEGLARTSTDINWTTQGEAKYRPLTNTGPAPGSAANTIENAVPALYCVFSSVCDWNLIMRSSDISVPNQCFSMQGVLNG
jgi:hypothetical protein